MNIIFIGPPFAGKGTQAKILSEKLNIPVFSMGGIIREEYEKGNPKAVEGYENYTVKGHHVPNELKFGLLQERLELEKNGFIIDNYPATQEDLDTFMNYCAHNNITIDKVFAFNISENEMTHRIVPRGRADDNPEVVMTRRVVQDQDRIPVIEYFKKKDLLVEINGEQSIEDVHKQIMTGLTV